MKTVLKRLLSFVLVAMMLVSVVPFQTWADGESVPANVTFYLNENGDGTVEKEKTITKNVGDEIKLAWVKSHLEFDESAYGSYSIYYRTDDIDWTVTTESVTLTGDTYFAINTTPKTEFDVGYTVKFVNAAVTGNPEIGSYSIDAAKTGVYEIEKAIAEAKTAKSYAAPTHNFDAYTATVGGVAVSNGQTVTADATVIITIPTYVEYAVTLTDKKADEGKQTFDVLYTTKHKLLDRPNGEPDHDNWVFLRWDSYEANYGTNLTSLYNETLTSNWEFFARYDEADSENKDGKSDLKVVGKYYVDGLLKGEKVLLTIADLDDGTNVYDILNKDSMKEDVSDAIVDKLGTAAEWIDGKYYENAKGSELITSEDVLDGDRTVYVMVGKEGAIKVQLYVHLSYKEEPTYIVNVFGFEGNDTIDRDDIKTVLKDKWPDRTYSFEGMYTNKGWTDVLAGKEEVTALKTFPLYDEDVYTDHGVANIHIYATRVYSSASDNPKTGDSIMMAGTVLGVSTAALAVLYFLNKKKQVM